MTQFILRRFLSMIPVTVLVSVMVFGITNLLPGDPALAVLGEERARDEELYQAMRERLGLNTPVHLRYLYWVRDMLTGDFGTSLRTGQPVLSAVSQRIGPTLQLALMSLLISTAVAVPLGIISALKQDSWIDVGTAFFSLVGVAIPDFWFGILLVLLLSLQFGWLPPSGYAHFLEDPVLSMRLMLMPVVALSLNLVANLVRQTRAALIEVMQDDYIRTARSKGLGEGLVVTRHALKMTLIPVITVLGMRLGQLFGGTVILETVFMIPGMGRLATDSIFFQDFPVLQGTVMIMAMTVLTANLLADLAYAFLDPRIAYR